MKAISGMFNALTGTSARHNKALREVKDWAGIVQKFLTRYDLSVESDFSRLLGDVGDAKFDLTSIVYKSRPLVKTSRKIKGQDISPLVSGIHDSTEILRRVLIDPSLQSEKISQAVTNLCSSFEKLQGALAEIEFM